MNAFDKLYSHESFFKNMDNNVQFLLIISEERIVTPLIEFLKEKREARIAARQATQLQVRLLRMTNLLVNT